MNSEFITDLVRFFESGNSDPDALFTHFENHCEVTYWDAIFKTRNLVRVAIEGLPRINIPPAVYPVIQSDGYKKWIDNPNYELQKALSECRDEEIQKVRIDRSVVAEQAFLNYLRFIRRWDSFISHDSKPFSSVDEIHDFLNKRCSDYWLDHFDLQFEEWLNDWFWSVDFSNIIEPTDSPDGSLCTESFSTFPDALDRAKNLAYNIGSEVAIQRNDGQWLISYQSELEQVNEYSTDGNEDYKDEVDEQECLPSEFSDDYNKDHEDARAEIVEEISEYGWGMARSDSEGWFYSD